MARRHQLPPLPPPPPPKQPPAGGGGRGPGPAAPTPPPTTNPPPQTTNLECHCQLHLDHLSLRRCFLRAFLFSRPQRRSRMSHLGIPGHFLCATATLEPNRENALPTGPKPHGLSQHARFTTSSLDFTIRDSHYRREQLRSYRVSLTKRDINCAERSSPFRRRRRRL